MMSEGTNGWAEWSKYVLKELERLNNNYESLSRDNISRMSESREERSQMKDDLIKEIDSIRKDVVAIKQEMIDIRIKVERLEIKSGIWGFAAGSLPIIMAIVAKLTGLW